MVVTEVKVNPNTSKFEIDALENHRMYLVKDGKVILIDLPNYGTTEIISFAGKVDRVETKISTKI